MAIKLAKESEERSLLAIKRFFAERLESDIGDLKALLVLEFLLREIGPSIYNQAIKDAQAYLQERVTDLDGSCYEPEHTYWQG